jgi:hypothetical protein
MGSDLLKRIGDFLARVPGLPIMIAVVLVALNFLLQLLPATWPVVGWLARTHLLLHIGVILGFVGMLLGDAL